MENAENRQGLTLALAKGRIMREALPLLGRIGICPTEDPEQSRRLILQTSRPNVRLLIIRSPDVPVYVELGAAELGMVGSDVLLEYGGNSLYDPLDLGIGACRMMLAAPRDRRPVSPMGVPGVATKYPVTTRCYFAAQNRQMEIIRLYGALELAPMMGIADYVVDLVDTGRTMELHGLEPLEKIADVSTRLIINKTAMKVKHAAVNSLLEELRQIVRQSSGGDAG